MKTRESGMPAESAWAGFFDPPVVLKKLGLNADVEDVVEFGCGYGTFTIPAARIVRGVVHAIDIDPAMIECVRRKAEAAAVSNIALHLRDFVTEGSGLSDATCDYAMLFNILHAECPEILLGDAFRVLRPGGRLGIMHWNCDPNTPRGPDLSIRPSPEQCQEWAERCGLISPSHSSVDLPPYHYGLILKKLASNTFT